MQTNHENITSLDNWVSKYRIDNTILGKRPLYWTYIRKGTVSQYIQVNRCIAKTLRTYAYTQPTLILMYPAFYIVTVWFVSLCVYLSLFLMLIHVYYDLWLWSFLVILTSRVISQGIYSSVSSSWYHVELKSFDFDTLPIRMRGVNWENGTRGVHYLLQLPP